MISIHISEFNINIPINIFLQEVLGRISWYSFLTPNLFKVAFNTSVSSYLQTIIDDVYKQTKAVTQEQFDINDPDLSYESLRNKNGK